MSPPSCQELNENRTFFRKYWRQIFPSSNPGGFGAGPGSTPLGDERGCDSQDWKCLAVKQTVMSPPDAASQAQLEVTTDPCLPEFKCGTWGFLRKWVMRSFLKHIKDKIFTPCLFQSDAGSMWSAEYSS